MPEGAMAWGACRGAKKVREKLPGLIEAVRQAGQTVVWVSDPMHGNTETVNGYKTRRYDNIRCVLLAHGWRLVARGRQGLSS